MKDKKLIYNADNSYNTYNYNATATWKCDHFSSADISAELKSKRIRDKMKTD